MLTYGGIPFSESGKNKSKDSEVCVVGFPSDLGASTAGGQADGPRAIRLAGSARSGWVDAGDARPFVRNQRQYMSLVTDTVATLAESTDLIVALGGDDSVSYGIARGLTKAIGDEVQLIHLDAHSDTYLPGADEPDELDHASWVRYLAVDKKVAVSNWGQRAERVYHSNARLSGDDHPVFLSIDMDVIDPAYAPGVACPVPFGPTPGHLIDYVRLLPGRVVCIAVNEVAPSRDINGITALTAARMIERIIDLRRGVEHRQS